jgi:2-polyprenyl-3-methyl-5-hydroxy-6-metoxy-1,4-benzoquinol methylase
MMQMYLGLMQRLAPQKLDRQLEMDVVMYDQEQDEQFTLDGKEGGLSILYQVIVDAILKLAPERGRALDLGCGSGQLICRIASEMPEMQFTGLDLSVNMLDFARASADQYGLDNIEFIQGSWFDLAGLGRESYDLVTWHLALHHCDTPEDVVRVIDAAAELVKPDGTLILFDIRRPKTGRLAVHLADLYSMRWGSWFYQDTLDSYKAAFTFDEMEEILAASRLDRYVHVEPLMFNFWQIAFVSSTRNSRRRSRSHLRRWWQKRDYMLLKAFFVSRF